MSELGKLLYVDDDLMNGKFLSARLNKKGFECDFVTNHLDCYEAIQNKDYDLILLDIMMPDVSGLDVLEKIRELKNNFELPIMMVTSKDETVDIVDALKLGANDYLVKPVNLEIAIARINTQVKIKRLIKDSLHAEQVKTINTLVTTLNHEINNPLAIAIGNLRVSMDRITPERVERTLGALDRITNIVKKIDKITNGEIEEVEYSSSAKMYKLG